MSEPNDTSEEVELPPIDVTRQDHARTIEYYEANDGGYRACDIGHSEFKTKSEVFCRERQLKASLAANREKDAEIERLRVELAKTGTGDYKADFYLGRKTLSGYLRDAEDDRDGWKRMYDAKKAECASLCASVDGEKPEDAFPQSAHEWLQDALGRYQVTHIHASIRAALKAMNVTEVAPPSLPEKEK